VFHLYSFEKDKI